MTIPKIADSQVAARYLRLSCGLLLLLSSLLTRPAASTELEVILVAESLPGVVWATVDQEAEDSGGDGYADLESARPMSALTKVQVGSVTKTLIALGVLQLVSAGELDLDARIEQLVPDLNWDNPWHAESPITVQHLLEHTSGLDNIRMWQFLNTDVTADTPLTEAFPASHEELLRVRTEPGSQYSYSNLGYALLGLLIERVSTERYEDYLARELLKPLGMDDSSFHFTTQDTDPRLAMGYLDGGTPQESVPFFLRPSGQFTTTAEDMQILLRFLLGNGNGDGNGERLIAPEYLEKLGRPSTTDAYRSGLRVGHGLALAARDRHGVLGECHPGTTFGFRAYLCTFRAQKKAFFYAVNADIETADYERLTEYFIRKVDVLPVSEVPAIRVPAVHLDDHAGLYKVAPANMAQFAWLDWMFNSIWLTVDQDRGGLVMHSLQGPERLLLPLGQGLFRDANRRVASHVFIDNEYDALSTGLASYERASSGLLLLEWTSVAVGVLGLLYLLVRGTWLVVRRDAKQHGAFLLPWLCLLAFSLPAYLYTQQSFLQFGEVTAASVLLAILSAFLPLTLLIALHGALQSSKLLPIDLYAVLASLQLCILLLLRGVLPVMFWI